LQANLCPMSRADLHCHSSASEISKLGCSARRASRSAPRHPRRSTRSPSAAAWTRARLGRSATFLGWLEGDALAAAYASADLFLFCSRTDTFGQVVLEAQASGLPVVTVAAGGPAELIADGRSGVLCPPRPEALASAVAALAGSRAARERLARGGLAAVTERSWERSLGGLGAGWRRALAPFDGVSEGVAKPS
jgi:hypothetical protein